MKKIYLFCSAGMSTSMLAQEMQNVADAHGPPLEVKAYSHSKIGDIVEQLHPDCILPEANHQLLNKSPDMF